MSDKKFIPRKVKYFTGTKRLKNVKMFEDFVFSMNEKAEVPTIKINTKDPELRAALKKYADAYEKYNTLLKAMDEYKAVLEEQEPILAAKADKLKPFAEKVTSTNETLKKAVFLIDKYSLSVTYEKNAKNTIAYKSVVEKLAESSPKVKALADKAIEEFTTFHPGVTDVILSKIETATASKADVEINVKEKDLQESVKDVWNDIKEIFSGFVQYLANLAKNVSEYEKAVDQLSGLISDMKAMR